MPALKYRSKVRAQILNYIYAIRVQFRGGGPVGCSKTRLHKVKTRKNKNRKENGDNLKKII